MENIRERDKSEPYYQDKLAGVEGFKQFLRDYADYAKSLFNSVDCKKVSYEISTADWKRYESEMISFLRLVEIPNPDFCPPNGVYVNEALGFEIVVDGLSIKDPTGYVRKLVPKSNNEYYVECLPTILRFDESMNIIISGIQICERWTTEGIIYKKAK